jgi:hypothetical protein
MKIHPMPPLALALLLLCLPISMASAATITTKSYKITIIENCEEDVACQDVTFTAKNLENGQRIRLKGQAVTSICSDGVTPCHHQGYKFIDGNATYFVSDDDWFEISRNGKIVLHEDFISDDRD